MTGKRFTEIYIPLGGPLYRVAFFILESRQDAEDALQDLYVRLWQMRDCLDDVQNPKAYCIFILKNICLDRLRKSGRECPEAVADGISDASDTETVIEAREDLSAAIKAMDTLSETKRELLRMRVFEGLSYREMAEKTGMNHLTMRVMISQARRKIKNSI